jgi:hypothetical protein
MVIPTSASALAIIVAGEGRSRIHAHAIAAVTKGSAAMIVKALAIVVSRKAPGKRMMV